MYIVILCVYLRKIRYEKYVVELMNLPLIFISSLVLIVYSNTPGSYIIVYLYNRRILFRNTFSRRQKRVCISTQARDAGDKTNRFFSPFLTQVYKNE